MRKRKGFALLLALLVLVLGAALMMAALFASQAAAAAATSDALRRIAENAAESAVVRAGETDASILRAQPIGIPLVTRSRDGETATTVCVDRVDTSLVWVAAVASVTRGTASAQHRIGMSFRVPLDSAARQLVPVSRRAWVELF